MSDCLTATNGATRSGNCREPSTAHPRRTRRRDFTACMTRSGADVLWEAWRQVKANKGAPGVDGMAIEWIINTGYEEEMIQQTARGAARATATSSHPYGWSRFRSRKAARDPRDCHGGRSRSPDGHEARPGADLRGGFSRLLLRLQTEAGCQASVQRDSRRPVQPCLERRGDRFPGVLHQYPAPEADDADHQADRRWQSAEADQADADGRGIRARDR